MPASEVRGVDYAPDLVGEDEPSGMVQDADAPRILAARSKVPLQAAMAALDVLKRQHGEETSGGRGIPARARKAGRPRKGEGVEVPRETRTLEGFEAWDRGLRAPARQ